MLSQRAEPSIFLPRSPLQGTRPSTCQDLPHSNHEASDKLLHFLEASRSSEDIHTCLPRWASGSPLDTSLLLFSYSNDQRILLFFKKSEKINHGGGSAEDSNSIDPGERGELLGFLSGLRLQRYTGWGACVCMCTCVRVHTCARKHAGETEAPAQAPLYTTFRGTPGTPCLSSACSWTLCPVCIIVCVLTGVLGAPGTCCGRGRHALSFPRKVCSQLCTQAGPQLTPRAGSGQGLSSGQGRRSWASQPAFYLAVSPPLGTFATTAAATVPLSLPWLIPGYLSLFWLPRTWQGKWCPCSGHPRDWPVNLTAGEDSEGGLRGRSRGFPPVSISLVCPYCLFLGKSSPSPVFGRRST